MSLLLALGISAYFAGIIFVEITHDGNLKYKKIILLTARILWPFSIGLILFARLRSYLKSL